MFKNSSRSTLHVVIAVVLAIVFHFLLRSVFTPLANFISDIFINILKLLSLPVIFLSIFTTLVNITNVSYARKLLLKVLKYTIITTLIAASLALIVFITIKPVHIANKPLPFHETPQNIFKTYLSFIKNIIPSNFIEAFAHNNVLGVSFIATILGLSILTLKDKEKEAIKGLFNGLFKATLKISSIIIKLLPIGIFAFTIQLCEEIHSNSRNLVALISYAACVILANILQGCFILPLFLKYKGLSVTKTAKAMLPALSTAFFSKSSSATLPITIRCMNERLKLNPSTTSFSLPLCSIINMNGCAAFILITTLFVNASYGMPLNILNMIPWIFISTIMAIGNAGIPMGCYFLTSAILVGMNTPLTLLGMILPLYTFFDMVETALNVWSDSCITTVIDKDLQTEHSKAPLIN